MAIATLIAAGRLDDRIAGEALELLRAAGLEAKVGEWIDRGDAIDLRFTGEAPTARRALEGKLDATDVIVQPAGPREKKLLVADMDSTMIGVECIDELADFAGIKDEVAAITERAMQGELDFANALAERVALLANLEETAIEQCRRERVRPNPGARTLVATMRARGASTLLVTGGFTAFAEAVARDIGFEHLLANRLAVVGGRLTGVTQGPIIDSAAKRAALEAERDRLGLGVEETLAIGDGANDIAMIRAAGLGVGYRPKPRLAAAADARLDFNPLSALLWAQGIARRDWLEEEGTS